MKEDTKVIINHYLADGRKVENIERYKVPINEKTKIAYIILASVKEKTA